MTRKSRAQEEIALINGFFRDYRINAQIAESASHVAGQAYIVMVVSLRAGGRINMLEARLPELAELLSAYRGQPTPVRLRRLPLSLEIPHPEAAPVLPPLDVTLKPHTLLCGLSYGFDGAEKQEIIDLSRAPHTLIAGTTGSGKSVLMSGLLWSLTKFTSPEQVRLVIIDLKNEDLLPFVSLPHTMHFASTTAEAEDEIGRVWMEKERRIKNRERRQRWVLVIDELAELSSSKGAMKQIASILAIGRSKSINVIAATQKPLSDIVGSVAKANFTVRLVGRMMSADDSKVAAGVAGVGAEYLPGAGAFVRVEGMDVTRFQAYWLDNIDERMRIVSDDWYRQLPLHQEWVVGDRTADYVA